jgi:hypothetical protein
MTDILASDDERWGVYRADFAPKTRSANETHRRAGRDPSAAVDCSQQMPAAAGRGWSILIIAVLSALCWGALILLVIAALSIL